MRVRARHTCGITANATNDSRSINLRYKQLVSLLSRCERVVFSITVIHMPLKTHTPVATGRGFLAILARAKSTKVISCTDTRMSVFLNSA